VKGGGGRGRGGPEQECPPAGGRATQGAWYRTACSRLSIIAQRLQSSWSVVKDDGEHARDRDRPRSPARRRSISSWRGRSAARPAARAAGLERVIERVASVSRTGAWRSGRPSRTTERGGREREREREREDAPHPAGRVRRDGVQDNMDIDDAPPDRRIDGGSELGPGLTPDWSALMSAGVDVLRTGTHTSTGIREKRGGKGGQIHKNRVCIDLLQAMEEPNFVDLWIYGTAKSMSTSNVPSRAAQRGRKEERRNRRKERKKERKRKKSARRSSHGTPRPAGPQQQPPPDPSGPRPACWRRP